MRQLIKKILPSKLLLQIKALIHRTHQASLPFFAKNPFLAKCYFSFFNNAYQREQFSILQGMLNYNVRTKHSAQQTSNPLLRRNTHRLEKGLIMKPLKPIFALDYIEETQAALFFAINSEQHQADEIAWASAVLARFYQSVDLTQSTLLATLAAEFYNKQFAYDLSLTPYQNSELAKAPLSYQEFAQFIDTRRSTRWFKQSPVCREKIKQAVTLASQAPSACNRQPYEFYVIDQEPLLNKVSKLAIGGGGFADNIPCLIALIGDYSCYEHERDRHVIYIDASLAAMQFMQTLPTLGLASCPMNWPELKVVDNKISQLLGLPHYKKTIMLIAVGEPVSDGGIPYSQKKSAEQLIHFVNTSE
ncbi:nitroreductase family protein [Colwellia sp. D2M02]|uniref:nitroreductase family protein n=1 Tax=Colwellia sp. D2M02 TaxID=2841562 RepID=UPI001C094365|nr:nitroreductase family protein [Colwellia sp. D2M02]MBU2891951.1 nitroreductase family protein [Colwellia sp. D2M02]